MTFTHHPTAEFAGHTERVRSSEYGYGETLILNASRTMYAEFATVTSRPDAKLYLAAPDLLKERDALREIVDGLVKLLPEAYFEGFKTGSTDEHDPRLAEMHWSHSKAAGPFCALLAKLHPMPEAAQWFAECAEARASAAYLEAKAPIATPDTP